MAIVATASLLFLIVKLPPPACPGTTSSSSSSSSNSSSSSSSCCCCCSCSSCCSSCCCCGRVVQFKVQKWPGHCVLFAMCFAPQWRALFRHLNFKVLQDRQGFTFLISKCASRHIDVHFLNISTSKSAPTLRCFEHFDFEMCFAPQCHALFEHLNFQVLRTCGVFTILTSKCASRHNEVHFFNISTSMLRT